MEERDPMEIMDEKNAWTSASIKNIAKALAAAQRAFKPIVKDKKGFKYTYASLDSCLRSVEEGLWDHGLTYITQVVVFHKKEYLRAVLMHESGEWLASYFPIAPSGDDRMNIYQQFGSGFTYLRRYLLSALLNIAPDEDTDAADVVNGKAKNSYVKPNFTPRKKTEIGEVIMKLSEQLNAEGLDPKVLMDYLKHFSEKKSVSVNEMAQSAVDSPGMFVKHYQRWLVEKA